jgi:hypothetical protein
VSRNLPAPLDAAARAAVVRPFVAAEFFFDEGVARANTTPYNLSFVNALDETVEFLGVSKFGEISEINETAELAAQKISLRLYGIPRDMQGQMLATHYQGRRAHVYVGLLDESHLLIGAILLFAGKIDNARIILGRQASITVTLISMLADWERPRDRRYTKEDQAIDHPGDKFFDYVPIMIHKQVKWGRV